MQKFFTLIIALTFFHSFSSFAQKKSDFRTQVIPVTRDYALQKIEQYLVKDEAIRDYFEVDHSGIKTFYSPEDKVAGKVEMMVYWEEVDAFNRMVESNTKDFAMNEMLKKGSKRWTKGYADSLPPLSAQFEAKRTGNAPLKGLKIAIDPGHLGGTMEFAEMERKYMKMETGAIPGYPGPIAFNEGNLTLATGLLLRKRLEEAGAEVLMTREKEGQSAFGMKFDAWKKTAYTQAFAEYAVLKDLSKEDIKWWREKATDYDIFHRIFKHLDLRERARKINEWKPDLTVIIHFNVEESNKSVKEGFFGPTENNFNMAFISGGFMEGELDTTETRFEFLRQVLTLDIERSEKFSGVMVEEFARYTQVPIIEKEEGLKYLVNASLKTDKKGVYARNLAMTKFTHGTICFGETLYQDNVAEAKWLNSIDLSVGSMRTSNRVKYVSEAYFQGILRYVTGNINK